MPKVFKIYERSPRMAFWLPVVVFAPVIAIAVWAATSADRELANSGVVTRAVVTAKHPNDHMTVSAVIVIDGRTHERRIRPNVSNRGYHDIRVGDSIFVTYLPPDAVYASGPRPEGMSSPWAVGLLGFVMAGLLGAMNAWRVRRHRGLLTGED